MQAQQDNSHKGIYRHWPEARITFDLGSAKKELVRLQESSTAEESCHGLIDAALFRLENCEDDLNSIKAILNKFYSEHLQPLLTALTSTPKKMPGISCGSGLASHLRRAYAETRRAIFAESHAAVEEMGALTIILAELRSKEQAHAHKKRKSVVKFNWKEQQIEVEVYDLVREWHYLSPAVSKSKRSGQVAEDVEAFVRNVLATDFPIKVSTIIAHWKDEVERGPCPQPWTYPKTGCLWRFDPVLQRLPRRMAYALEGGSARLPKLFSLTPEQRAAYKDFMRYFRRAAKTRICHKNAGVATK